MLEADRLEAMQQALLHLYFSPSDAATERRSAAITDALGKATERLILDLDKNVKLLGAQRTFTYLTQ